MRRGNTDFIDLERTNEGSSRHAPGQRKVVQQLGGWKGFIPACAGATASWC